MRLIALGLAIVLLAALLVAGLAHAKAGERATLPGIHRIGA